MNIAIRIFIVVLALIAPQLSLAQQSETNKQFSKRFIQEQPWAGSLDFNNPKVTAFVRVRVAGLTYYRPFLIELSKLSTDDQADLAILISSKNPSEGQQLIEDLRGFCSKELDEDCVFDRLAYQAIAVSNY